MKAKILSLLLVVALLVTVGVFAAKTPAAAEYQRPEECDIDYSGALQWTDPEAHTAVCPVCGGNPVVWKPLPALDNKEDVNSGSLSHQLSEDGHYYLDPSEPYNQTKYQYRNKADGGTYCIYLNGQNLVTSGNPFLYPDASSTWNIMGSGTVQQSKATGTAGLIYYAGAATVNLYGGTYSYGSATTHSKVAINLYAGGANSKLNIYNGVIIENCGPATGTSNGGAILVSTAGSEVNIYGGTIRNNRASYGGASVYISGGCTVNMHGGTISGGKKGGQTNGNGGNVRLANAKAVFKMYNGTIENGDAFGTGSGGNVALTTAGATFEMYDGTISGGETTGTGNGGNVALTVGNTHFEMYGGEILDGVTKYNGGNIYVVGASDNKSTVSISGDSTISGGKVTTEENNHYGGNLCVGAYADVTISNGTISGGSVVKAEGVTTAPTGGSGGNIMILANGTVRMTNGTIANGAAKLGNSHGGNVYAVGTFTLEGGQLYGGVAGGYGGNVGVCAGTGIFNMTDGTLNGAAVEGVAANDGNTGGNNLAVYAGTANLTGGEIINGSDKDHSVLLTGDNAVINVGGDVEIDQLGIYGKKTGDVRVVYSDGINIQKNFTGIVNLQWYSTLLESENATETIAESITYGSVLGAPVVVDPSYANGGTITVKDMTAFYVDHDGNGTKELYIPTYIEVGDAHLKLMADSVITVTEDVLVDTNGNALEVTTENGALVSLMDSANDEYDVEPGKVTIAKDALAGYKVTNGGKHYITVYNVADETYSAHRIELKISSVNIRPSRAGIYYGATFSSDATLAGATLSYGIAASAEALPENLTDSHVRYTAVGDPYTSGVEAYGVLFSDFLLDINGEGYEEEVPNSEAGKTIVYAKPYVIFDTKDGKEVMVMLETGAEYSLYTVLKAFDENEALYEANKAALNAFYTDPKWGNLGWGFKNIGTSN